jgi:transcriptional regulator with GAF, ATPase, and Fis domain
MSGRSDRHDFLDPMAILDAEGHDVTPLKEARHLFERRYVLAVLRRCNWSVAAAARALGLQRPNFYRKARQLHIPVRPPDTES